MSDMGKCYEIGMLINVDHVCAWIKIEFERPVLQTLEVTFGRDLALRVL